MSMQPFRQSAMLRYALGQMKPYRGVIVVNIVNVLLRSLLFLVPPVIIKYVLEQVLPQQNWNMLLVISVCIVLVPVVGSLMIVLQSYSNRFMLNLAGQARADLYDGMQRRPLHWFRLYRPGDLIARTLDDTHTVAEFAASGIWWMLWLAVSITAGSGVLVYLHAGLAAVIVPLWLAHAALVVWMGRHVKRRASAAARQMSRVTESVREIVTGAAWIKASGMEEKALAGMASGLEQEWSLCRRGMVTDHLVQLVNTALSASFLVIMYYAGGRFVAGGGMTIGTLIAFIAVYNWLRPFGITLAEMYFALQRAMAAAERIAEIAASEPRERDREVDQARLQGIRPVFEEADYALEAEGLSFRYGDKTVLAGLSLRIRPGEVVSIVGKRGSGKSTLADVLLKLRPPAAGTVSVCGAPQERIDEQWLRRHMLCVTQDVMLCGGTIRDNVAYGCADADDAAIRRALVTAELDAWLSALPEGLDTPVGEQATRLSGGERQRIGIARAVLRRPSVLILDEATSALDQGTERRLLDRLLRQLQGTTLLFITHRLSIAEQSDRIIVMKDGMVAETGTYRELVEAGGHFRKLHDSM